MKLYPALQDPLRSVVRRPQALRGQSRRGLLGLWAITFLFATVFASSARADVWGYLDAQGIAHFAQEQLDKRYELYFRSTEGDTVFNAGQAGQVGGVAAEPAKLLTYFDVSPGFKAVKHLLRDASLKYGIDFELLQALIATESGFNTQAVSPKGAVGLMQLIPPTARRYGVRADKNTPIQKKLTDPAVNIRAGASYLSDLIAMFPGQLELAVAAYNAGEGAVQRAGNRIPNYPETIRYVKTVMALYEQLKPPQLMTRSRRVHMEIMGNTAEQKTPALPNTLTADTVPGQQPGQE
jgi:hypothetical protein